MKLASTDGFSGDEWLGTDIETATARAEDGRSAAARGAKKERFQMKPGTCRASLARGTVRGRPVAAQAHGRRHGEKQRRKRDGDGGDGSFVNNSKFSPSSWP